ncbi:MAG TPA: MBL fold metallo-hydrolase [Candidatus Limnocylindria bacterium]
MLASSSAAGIELCHHGQAGFVIRGQGTALGIDLFLSDRADRLFAGVAPESLAPLDAILTTHEHGDHFDRPSWPRLAASSPGARFIVPAPLVDAAAEVVDRDRVDGAFVDREIRIGAARIVPVPARHGRHLADAYTFGTELSGGLHRYLGYVIELGGVRVYHGGDTIRYGGMAERLRTLAIDVALLPINGRTPEREALGLVGNLGYAEAADLAADAGIPVLIPMHFDLIGRNSEDPRKLVADAAARHPGLTIRIPERRVWMHVAVR